MIRIGPDGADASIYILPAAVDTYSTLHLGLLSGALLINFARYAGCGGVPSYSDRFGRPDGMEFRADPYVAGISSWLERWRHPSPACSIQPLTGGIALFSAALASGG